MEICPEEMLLSLLLRGGRVEQGGMTYAMDEDYALCALMYDDQGEERPVRVDCDIKGFCKMAQQIGKDDLWLMCCAMRLND